EVVAREQHLPEVIVAVVADLHRGAGRRRAALDALEELAPSPGELRLLRLAPLDEREGLLRFLGDARLPGGDVFGGERRGPERRRQAGGEGAVQLGGAHRERLREGEVGAVHLSRRRLLLQRIGDRAPALHVTLEVVERVAPAVALVRDVGLQQRERGGLFLVGGVFHRAGDRDAVLVPRLLGEVAADLELGVHART